MTRLALVLGIWLFAFPLSATTVHVPSEYLTIRDAVTAAAEGDTVLVAPGTYTGTGNRDIDFGGKNLVLKSESGPDVTIIDCQASGVDHHRAIHLHSGEDSSSVIDGFTVTGAYIDSTSYAYWAALMFQNAAPIVRNCVVMDNSCIGVSYYQGPNPAYVRSTKIINNGYNLASPKQGLTIVIIGANVDSCLVDSNAAEGAYLYHAYPTVRWSAFTGNGWAGLIVVEFLGADSVQIDGCTFANNINGLVCSQDWPKTGAKEQFSSSAYMPTISQCLFAYNTEDGFRSDNFGTTGQVSCCDAFGNGTRNYNLDYSTAWDTVNCYTADPLVCDTSISYTEVSSSSFCFAANNSCGTDIGALTVGCGSCCSEMRGNVDYDPADAADIGDIVYLVEYAFGAGPPPPCFEEADVNGDGSIDIGDLIYLVEWSMSDGPAPAACP